MRGQVERLLEENARLLNEINSEKRTAMDREKQLVDAQADLRAKLKELEL